VHYAPVAFRPRSGDRARGKAPAIGRAAKLVVIATRNHVELSAGRAAPDVLTLHVAGVLGHIASQPDDRVGDQVLRSIETFQCAAEQGRNGGRS
jgi:hypothetical protein